jgi:hypothetical protein
MEKKAAIKALFELYEQQITELCLISKIELGDDVIAEIQHLKEIINSNQQDPKDIKYGLMVVDPNQEGEMLDIIHFVGYWEKPTKLDADSLRKELMIDEVFGLTEIAHSLDILPAPDHIVEKYVKEIIASEEN